MSAADQIAAVVEAVRAENGAATFQRLAEVTGLPDAELRIAAQAAKRDGLLRWERPVYVLDATARDTTPSLGEYLAGGSDPTPQPEQDPDVTALGALVERFRARLQAQAVADLERKIRLLRELSAYYRDDYAALLADTANDLERLAGSGPAAMPPSHGGASA